MWRTFDQYARAHRHVEMSRSDGILELRLHTDGGSLVWSATAHEELGRCFWDVAHDRETRSSS